MNINKPVQIKSILIWITLFPFFAGCASNTQLIQKESNQNFNDTLHSLSANTDEKTVEMFNIGLPVSVSDLAWQTPENVAKLLRRTQDKGFLSTNKRVLITGYSYDGYNIQLDHDLHDGKKCIYIGVSFSDRPLPESQAWDIVHFKPPPRVQYGNNVYWFDEQGVNPFWAVRRIRPGFLYQEKAFSYLNEEVAQRARQLVGKLAFEVISLKQGDKVYGGTMGEELQNKLERQRKSLINQK